MPGTIHITNIMLKPCIRVMDWTWYCYVSYDIFVHLMFAWYDNNDGHHNSVMYVALDENLPVVMLEVLKDIINEKHFGWGLKNVCGRQYRLYCIYVCRLSLKMEPPGDDSSDGDEHAVKSCLPLVYSPQHQAARVEGTTPATVGRRGSSLTFVPHHRKTRSLAPE